jgi:glycosyltransferase involved in cell wall biosynthesis
MNSLKILGTRGIPAAHGGFETFAERLALYLVSRGWVVTVYCQEVGTGPLWHDQWEGVHRVHIPMPHDQPTSTVSFDWQATWHAARDPGLCLTLGYNTALFCAILRARGVPNVINMDGIEWRRAKWGPLPKLWFWLNDYAGRWLGNTLVADHPQITAHLATVINERKIHMIPYGADRLIDIDDAPLRPLGLESGRFLTVVARAEPENSILEIVQGFSSRRRGFKLAVLGNYSPAHAYHRAVQAAASDEVMFLGAIYDKTVLSALRYHSAAYVHGHQVGGTNPSLVEALGAGNAVLAHDNRFNRWVAGDAGRYFSDAQEFSGLLDELLADSAARQRMQAHARDRHSAVFTWPAVMLAYEELLTRHQQPVPNSKPVKV